MRRQFACKHGFTLIELLTVITVIGILVALAFPAWTTVREFSRRTTCASNLRQIGQGCIQYSISYGDYFPTATTPTGDNNPLLALSLLYDNYIPQRKLFVCPSTADICMDLNVGESFLPHGIGGRTYGDLRQTSYGYDCTKGPVTDPDVAMAADAPPAPEEDVGGLTSANMGTTTTTLKNSANHRRGQADRGGQNVLFYNGQVKWCVDPTVGVGHDNIYDAADQKNPGATDSYIRQQ